MSRWEVLPSAKNIKRFLLMPKPNVYFAHSKLDYNTKAEKDAIKTLSAIYNVFCPNNNLGETGSMYHYLNIVKWCDETVVLEHKELVGKGVYEEVQTALQNKKPTFVLRAGKLLKVTGVKVVNSDNWKQFAQLQIEKQ
jgi:hypothetical protein